MSQASARPTHAATAHFCSVVGSSCSPARDISLFHILVLSFGRANTYGLRCSRSSSSRFSGKRRVSRASSTTCMWWEVQEGCSDGEEASDLPAASQRCSCRSNYGLQSVDLRWVFSQGMVILGVVVPLYMYTSLFISVSAEGLLLYSTNCQVAIFGLPNFQGSGHVFSLVTFLCCFEGEANCLE